MSCLHCQILTHKPNFLQCSCSPAEIYDPELHLSCKFIPYSNPPFPGSPVLCCKWWLPPSALSGRGGSWVAVRSCFKLTLCCKPGELKSSAFPVHRYINTTPCGLPSGRQNVVLVRLHGNLIERFRAVPWKSKSWFSCTRKIYKAKWKYFSTCTFVICLIEVETCTSHFVCW